MGKDKNNKNNKMGVISLVISLVIVVMFVTILVAQTINKNDNTLPYTDLIKQVEAGNVKQIEMTTGSASVKVILKNEIDKDGKVVEYTYSQVPSSYSDYNKNEIEEVAEDIKKGNIDFDTLEVYPV